MRDCDKTIIKIISRDFEGGKYGANYLYYKIAESFERRTGIRYTWRDIKKVLTVD
jgi:hypothetical protein